MHAETVLVLPFFNHSKSQNLDWIGESIAEAVQDSLASEGLLVLDREDRLEAYRRQSLRPGAEITHASIIKIGESLDASQAIYGYYELLPAAGQHAIQRLAAHHRAPARPEAHTAKPALQRNGRAGGPGGYPGSPRMAGAPDVVARRPRHPKPSF